MKLGKNRIHLLIMLFAVSSLLVHVPSDAFAADTWTAATTNVGNQLIYGVSMGDASNGVAVGNSDQDLPPWVTNLALWVSEGKITPGDMIVSIEHLINN